MKYKNRWWQRLIPIILVIVLTVIGLALPVGTTISADKGYVSFSINTASAIEIPVQAQPQYEGQPTISSTATNNYNITLSKENIHIGDTSKTSSFSPKITIPRWGETSIGLTMAVTGNTLATTFTGVTTNSTSIIANNTYMTCVYSGVGVKSPYNENGGLDLNITIKQNIGNTIAFGYDHTNVNAYLQPSLIKEWTVGQASGNGRTVASVTDTDVTDNLGNMVAHRPEYVVNAIAFYHNSKGGLVSTTDAARGLTTGQIGMLYNLNVVGANGVKGKAYWSIPNSNTLWLTFDPTGMTYPIVLSPAGDTFGYTTLGGSSSNSDAYNNYITTNYLASMGASGTATLISIGAPSTNNPTVALAIYTTSGNSTTAGKTCTLISGSNGTVHWITPAQIAWHNITISVSLTAQYYALVAIGDSYWNSAGQWAYNTAGSNKASTCSGQTYPTFPSSIAFNGTGAISNVQYSIYCTYTAGGGATAPTVVTGAASSILDTKATCAENVTATGGANVTAWGTLYGTTTGYGSNVTNTGSNNVSFGWSDALSGLSANTTYYYKGFATNSAGSANGTSANFTTGYVTYSANQTTYNFGIVKPSSTTNTSGTWILFTNTSSISTNISVKMLASTWTSAGTGWTHSDSAAGANTVAMKANSSNATTWATSVFITYNAPYSAIGTNIAANSNYCSGLSLLAPTSFTDGYSDNNTIRFTFFSSS